MQSAFSSCRLLVFLGFMPPVSLPPYNIVNYHIIKGLE